MDKIEMFKILGSVVSTVSVVVGIVISVLSFERSRAAEKETRKIEAAKPFLELRQKLYLEALRNASILVSKDFHTKEEIDSAKKRFSELYWGELSLVEEKGIEGGMIAVAASLNLFDPMTPAQKASYDLAHAMRESLVRSWGIDEVKVGSVNP